MHGITEVVKNLMIINVIIFITLRFNLIPIPHFEQYFFLSADPNRFKPIQLLTSLFTHFDERHLLFNMLGLYFLGPYVESILNANRFFILYMLSGLFGSLLQMYFSPTATIAGASGAVSGVFLAFATMFPNMEMHLMFIPIPIKAKYIAIGMLAFGIYFGITGYVSGIGHFAHVAGALCGYVLIKYWKMSNLR